MNKLCFLKEMMNPIVEKCLDKYGGGESYFTEIDAMIKSNPVLMSEYIQYITEKENIYNVIFSGEIGLKYFAMQLKQQIPSDINLFLLPGGLRPSQGNNVTVFLSKIFITYLSLLLSLNSIINLYFTFKSSKFIFLDDSYYSGKTLNAVSEFVKKGGGVIEKSYVFYDGSPVKTNVQSLYRYYDNLEN